MRPCRLDKLAVQKQQARLNEELKELNDHDVQLDQLERNVQILDGKYRMHVEKLEQARVNDALGRDGISNIKVAQAATLVGKPTSPKKPLLLALGLFAALGGALVLPFVAEVFDETLRTTDQVESELGLPVLLSFPYRKQRKSSSKSRLRPCDRKQAVDRACTERCCVGRQLSRFGPQTAARQWQRQRPSSCKGGGNRWLRSST